MIFNVSVILTIFDTFEPSCDHFQTFSKYRAGYPEEKNIKKSKIFFSIWSKFNNKRKLRILLA